MFVERARVSRKNTSKRHSPRLKREICEQSLVQLVWIDSRGSWKISKFDSVNFHSQSFVLFERARVSRENTSKHHSPRLEREIYEQTPVQLAWIDSRGFSKVSKLDSVNFDQQSFVLVESRSSNIFHTIVQQRLD